MCTSSVNSKSYIDESSPTASHFVVACGLGFYVFLFFFFFFFLVVVVVVDDFVDSTAIDTVRRWFLFSICLFEPFFGSGSSYIPLVAQEKKASPFPSAMEELLYTRWEPP